MNAMRILTLTLIGCVIGSGSQTVLADQVQLDVSPVRSVLKAGEKQMTWIRVGLEGFQLTDDTPRPAANVAIVMDKSGSMQGEKIERARDAAIDALHLLGPNDIVSIITYDSTVDVLVPATKLTDRKSVIAKIRAITAGGNTALFGGVSKGAAEIRKFLDKQRVNRVVLLSDGLANVGPSAPGELGSLGASLLKENISVTTLGLGLGYNEDLMAQLAGQSGGNHYFIEQASELADIFRREFDDVLSVVAQEVDITINIPEGIRPVRVLGNDADINGQQVVTRLASIYSQQNKHVVIEVETPSSDPNGSRKLATVTVSYTNMKTHATDRLSGESKVEFSDSDQAVATSLNRSVLADVVALVSSEKNKLATRYLDEGNLEMCRLTLTENAGYLQCNSVLIPEAKERLSELARSNERQADQLEGVTSNKDEKAISVRKGGRAYQNQLDLQQRVAPSSRK
jgi:Ca-activated chloride channel family protein